MVKGRFFCLLERAAQKKVHALDDARLAARMLVRSRKER